MTYRAFNFWNIVALVTDSLLLAAFTTRVLGINAEPDKEAELRLRSFQILSFVAPFIW